MDSLNNNKKKLDQKTIKIINIIKIIKNLKWHIIKKYKDNIQQFVLVN